MGEYKIKVMLLNEALTFVRSLPMKVQEKKQIVMEKMNMTSLDVLTDEVFGKIGTPKRDAMEAEFKEEVNACFVGETIRKMRQAQNLTQEQLGERVGVQKAQISKLEKGRSVITLPTISRIFQALGITSGILDLGMGGKITLW